MNDKQMKECAAAFDYEYGEGAWVDENRERDRVIFGTAWMHSVSEIKAFVTPNVVIEGLPEGSPARMESSTT